MTVRARVAAVAAGLLIALGTGAAAGAEDCDTWSRPGHEPGHPGSNDTFLPAGLGYIHSSGGHYYAELTGVAYVEIVGGQGYNNGHNQGGYVEADVLGVDFHFDSFAGANPPYAEGGLCVAGTRLL